MKNYYVYLLTNTHNTVLYTGVTNNIERRLYEHKNKLIKGFTEKYNVHKLVYVEETNDVNAAIAREKQIKGWVRAKKDALIINQNPKWLDLSAEWYGKPLLYAQTVACHFEAQPKNLPQQQEDPSAAPQDDKAVILNDVKNPHPQEILHTVQGDTATCHPEVQPKDPPQQEILRYAQDDSDFMGEKADA